jgi:hypothetical protein
MPEIKITQGYVALVDDEDYDRVNAFRWHLTQNSTNDLKYAARSEYYSNRKKTILMGIIYLTPRIN